jgi:DNA invertase Pin-like site-specific DNA recombinase
MKTIGYVRISTDKQELKNQKHRINEYAAKEGIKINQWVEETISSRKEDRAIHQLINDMSTGDKIIVTELSRLGRSSVTEIFRLIGEIQDKKGSLYVISENIEIKKGKPTVQAETMIFALSLSSRLERDMISQRTKAALAAKKAQGVKLGRPSTYSVLNGREDEIEKYLKLGINKTAIGKLMDVSRATVYLYLKKKAEREKGTQIPNLKLTGGPKKLSNKKVGKKEKQC